MNALICLLLTTAFAQDVVPPTPPEPTQAEALAPLEAAYQKEYAYLQAEKEGLERRLAAQQAEAVRTRAAADTELSQLEARLTALQIRVENADTLLTDVERAAATAMEAEDALASSWFQATNSLNRPGAELADPAEGSGLPGYAAAFRTAFGVAVEHLRQGASLRVTEGSFFGRDGVDVQGQLIEVGEIATFGQANGEVVALVPVGEGRLQAWREGGGATGAALDAGTTEPSMGLYLHEGRTKRIEERDPKTWADIFNAGGVVGYVILGLGGVALVLMALRILALIGAGAGDRAVDEAIENLGRGNVDGAIASVSSSKGSAAKVAARLLPHLSRSRGALEDLANEALLSETPRIERFGSAILVIAAVAPLLGLLGTVTGMIATFDIITEFGTGDPRMLSGGISEALVTTQFGLVVAIPALLGGNLLGGWGDVVMGRSENAALRVLNALDDGEDDGHTPPLRMAASK